MGNGYSMWVSLIAYGCRTLEEVEQAARLQAEITHNHREGIRGACAVVAAAKLALDGAGKETIREHVTFRYGYDLSVGPEEVRVKDGSFSATCPVTVPQAFAALFAGRDYESTIFSGDSATPAVWTFLEYLKYREIGILSDDIPSENVLGRNSY